MSWSIVEVARLSGVTSLTLRYYDEIGVLPPARIGSNGYRYYEEEQLLRLQQILVLRELGLGLAQIAEILDEQLDPVDALRSHHKRLLVESDRLGALVRTVARTIDELEHNEGVLGMPKINRPENLFEGFDPTEYDAEARERWPEQWEQSKEFTDTLSVEDTERMQREATAAMIRMAEFMAAETVSPTPASSRRLTPATRPSAGSGPRMPWPLRTLARCTWTTSGSGPPTTGSRSGSRSITATRWRSTRTPG